MDYIGALIMTIVWVYLMHLLSKAESPDEQLARVRKLESDKKRKRESKQFLA